MMRLIPNGITREQPEDFSLKRVLSILFFLLILSSSAWAAISLVQSNTIYPGTSLMFNSDVTAGNLIVITYQDGFEIGAVIGDPVVTDTLGNTFIKAVTIENTTSNTVADWIYYAIDTSTGSDTINITPGSGDTPDAGFDITEWSGVNTSFVSVNTVTGDGTDYLTGNVTTNGPALLITMGGEEVNADAATHGSGWTVISDQDSHLALSQYRIVGSAGTYAGTMSTADPFDFAMVIVAFGPSGLWPFAY
jgi:hypothetical protein